MVGESSHKLKDKRVRNYLDEVGVEMYRCILNSMLKPGHRGWYSHSLWRHVEPSQFHDHDFHELFWVEEGNGYHWINNEKRELKVGTLVLIRPEDAHGFSSAPHSKLHIVDFAFPSSSWEAIRKRYFREAPCFFSLNPLDSREYHLSMEEILKVRHAARALQDGACDLLTVERFLLNILKLLNKHRPPSEPTEYPDWLRRACEEIRRVKNLKGGTLLFAKLAGRSSSHVARACRKYLNTSPTDIVNEARMIYAATRFLSTDDPIRDVVVDCGFSNVGYFYRLFRSHFGFSPDVYRRHQRAAVRAGHGLVITEYKTAT